MNDLIKPTSAKQFSAVNCAEKLTISIDGENARTNVRLCGSVVGSTAGILLDAFSTILSNRCDHLHVDLTGVQKISRAGVRGIIVAAKIMQNRGGEFHIFGARAEVLKVLDNLSLNCLISDSIQDRPSIETEWSLPKHQQKLIGQPISSIGAEQ